jgi:4-hydroxybenzoate polyprenyltransferase
MRPRQWTKNLILLAPLLFSLELGQPVDLLRAISAVALFCLVCGAVYIVNDLHDFERDRLHATRRHRPLAAGELSPRVAAVAAAVLLAMGLGGGLLLSPWFAFVMLCYVALQTVYTLVLKNEVILDVMAIAAGFVLRVTAGAVAIHVAVSPWLLSCTALLALFLAFVKRRYELLADTHAVEHRPVLRKYTPALLDQAISVVTSSTFVVYAIYTFLSQSAADRPYLMLTIPFVGYGLLRYLYLMHARQLGGSPEEILLSDAPLAIDLGLWALVVVIVLYLT